MVMVKAKVQEKEIAKNLVWLYFETEEPFSKSTERFHKDLFFHTMKHLCYFAALIGQEAMNLVKKIMEMENIMSVTIFRCDRQANDYNNQELIVGIDTTNIEKKGLANIKSRIKELLDQVPVQKGVVRIPL